MGNKSFESKMNNASHDYVDGRHILKPHPDSLSSDKIHKKSDALSEENIKEYNKMKFTKDPNGILPDDSYDAGKN